MGSPSRRGRPPVIRAAERASRARAAISGGGSGGPYGPPGSDPDSHLMDEFVDDYYQDEDEDYYDEDDDYYEEGNEMMDDGEYPMCQVCPHTNSLSLLLLHILLVAERKISISSKITEKRGTPSGVRC